MVKKLLMGATTLLLFSGCAQNTPGVGDNVLDGDTVSVNDGEYASDGTGYNSSSDGFVSVYFDFDGYSIAPSQEARIYQNVKRFQSLEGSRIKIEGNCDEFGTDEYNYALGLKRAKAVKDALADQGVNTSNTVMVSFGESNPVCSENTDECYARNRRVDLKLVK